MWVVCPESSWKREGRNARNCIEVGNMRTRFIADKYFPLTQLFFKCLTFALFSPPLPSYNIFLLENKVQKSVILCFLWFRLPMQTLILIAPSCIYDSFYNLYNSFFFSWNSNWYLKVHLHLCMCVRALSLYILISLFQVYLYLLFHRCPVREFRFPYKLAILETLAALGTLRMRPAARLFAMRLLAD